MNLKFILLTYNIAVDNIYLDNYCELVLQNLTTTSIKYKTAKHHVIPVNCYKKIHNLKTRQAAVKQANLDSNNLIINLSYVDHLKAHLYLALASTDEYKSINSYAFNRLSTTGNKQFKLNIKVEELISKQELLEYQKLQEAVNEQRSKNTKQQHLDGKHKMSAEQKEKLRQASSGKISVVNIDEDRHYIKKEELQKYLDNGYIIGAYFNPSNNPHTGSKRTAEQKEHIKQGALNKNKHKYSLEEKKLISQKLSLALKGRPKSEETKNKLKETSARLKSWTDGNILIRSIDCPGPEFKRGLPAFMRKKRVGKKWYTNGIKSIIVLSGQTPPDGFIPGRCSRKK